MCGSHHHRTGRTDRHRSAEGAVAAPTRDTADLRVADAERDAVAAELREHAAQGRIGVEELDERVAAVLAARTRADLAAPLADLPRLPQRRDPRRAHAELRDHVRSYLLVMALLVAIWALTGAAYFWPVWPMLGWGIGVLSHAGGVRRTPSAT